MSIDPYINRLAAALDKEGQNIDYDVKVCETCGYNFWCDYHLGLIRGVWRCQQLLTGMEGVIEDE